MFQLLQNRSVLGSSSTEVFAAIYRENLWRNPESRSGWGSTLAGENGTEKIRQGIAQISEQYNISTIVDVPCGDFNWFRAIELRGATYLGVDIVPDLIARNRELFGSDNISFICQDLAEWVPPAADLIIVRDLLIHLTNNQATACLRNIVGSGARLLLVSNYAQVCRNEDTFTGGLRLYNLFRPPFDAFGIENAVKSVLADGDGNQGRQMLLCDVSALAAWSADI